jgi:hypothetical protein
METTTASKEAPRDELGTAEDLDKTIQAKIAREDGELPKPNDQDFTEANKRGQELDKLLGEIKAKAADQTLGR